MIEKKKLREKFLKIRSSIKNKEEKEKKICKFLSSLNFEKKHVLSGYYPVRNEVNILPFLEHLLKKNIPCVFLVLKRLNLF